MSERVHNRSFSFIRMAKNKKPFHYGGQAVIEGVMIRGQHNVSVAVRRPDGEIDITCNPLATFYKGRLRSIPFIRGIIVLIETMVLGIQALLHSAQVVAQCDLSTSAGTAQGLIPAIQDTLRSLTWAPSEIQLVAVAVGPGSFTRRARIRLLASSNQSGSDNRTVEYSNLVQGQDHRHSIKPNPH